LTFELPEIFIVAGTSLSKEVEGAKKIVQEICAEGGEHVFIVYLGLEGPPKDLEDKFDLIITMDCQEFADMVSSHLQKDVRRLKPEYYKQRIQAMDLLFKYHEALKDVEE
jgi:NAD-dependent SIR2 family protein deacetylase